MKRKTLLLATSALVMSSFAGTSANVAFAQDDNVEEIVVTGSYIKRKSQINSPSPIDVIGSDDFNAAGAKTIADITQNLTINTGAENNPDAFTQNATTGTTNINLRGLGLASTLVLLNGKRQVTTANPSDGGINFVDTSALVPQIAIDRVEIVKDGAAATYGTDAVAGVVNFITRDKFEGLELDASYQWVEGTGEASDRQLAAIVGHGGENFHIMAAVSHLKRTGLTTAERRLSRTQDDTSALGNPGAFYTSALPTGGAAPIAWADINPAFTAAAYPVIDPTGCAEAGGIPDVRGPTIPGAALGNELDYTIGLCGFDFGDYYNLVTPENRTQAFSRLTIDLGDTAELFAEVGYAESSLKRNNSPTFPYLKLPLVLGSHPDWPFGNVPGVRFFGRAVGNGGEAAINRFNYQTERMSVGARFDIGDWSNEFSVTHATNDARVRTPDVIAANFNDALLGFGGAGCDKDTDTAGEGDCSYYNPFYTSYTTSPNDPALFDWYMGEQDFQGKSKMTTYDYVVSGEVGETSQGPIGMALGMQVRDESLVVDYDAISNADGFGFLVGNKDYSGDRKVMAMFGELAVPITDKLEAQIALRFEDYNHGLGDTMDPKIALIYNANNNLAFRASYSTSFRAPSIFQLNGQQTALAQVVDPVSGGTFFAAVRTRGNANLKPEESTAFNLGMSWQTEGGFEVDVDYFNYDFKDAIVKEDKQALINAFPEDEDIVVRAAGAGTPILQVNANFINASSIKTDGFDVKASYTVETDSMGTFKPFVTATYINNYDVVDPYAGAVSGAGKRNFGNFATSTPQLRANLGLMWAKGSSSLNLFARYTDSYLDDQNDRKVRSHTTVDAQYNLNLEEMTGSKTSMTIGAINAFNKKPPQLYTNGGFDSKVGDPRGRLMYVSVKQAF